MGWLTLAITSASWGGLFLAANRCARAVHGTSLITAWRWLLGAGFAVCVMTTSDFLARLWPDQTADYGWCLTAILLLCPPMAVLGARRPGVQVWSLFILLPMVAVLSWPIWTLLLQGSEWRGLSLEAPTVLGFVLVLLMGAGNFLGTRFAMSAVWYVVGVLLLFLTCTGWSIVPASNSVAVRLGSILALEIAVLMGISYSSWQNLRRFATAVGGHALDKSLLPRLGGEGGRRPDEGVVPRAPPLPNPLPRSGGEGTKRPESHARSTENVSNQPATSIDQPVILARHRVNSVWNDFRDAFGIVWALRMVERINTLAVQEKWSIRLTLEGFPESTAGNLTANEVEVEAACRWLFRRFVDDEWITQRLGPPRRESP